MCIRDRSSGDHPLTYVLNEVSDCVLVPRRGASVYRGRVAACLLYTSDAADDLLCVELGGRRIIKKKNTED